MTWYLGYATTGREREVADDHTARGIHTWCGMVTVEKLAPKSKRKGPRVVTVEEPALPNYLFFEAEPDQFYQIKHKYLARTLTQLGPQSVREFDKYRQRVAEMDVIKSLRPGDMLEVTRSPLAGQMVRLKRLVEGRMDVEVTMFGGTVPANVSMDDVKVV